jgi:hypothetical protein
MLYVQTTIKKVAAKKLNEENVGASRYLLIPIIAVVIMAIRQHTILTDSINIERGDVGKVFALQQLKKCESILLLSFLIFSIVFNVSSVELSSISIISKLG